MAKHYTGLSVLTEKPVSFLDLILVSRSDKPSPVVAAMGCAVLGAGVVAILAGGFYYLPRALARSTAKSIPSVGQEIIDKILVPGLDLLLNLMGAPEGSWNKARRAELLERVRREDCKPLQMPPGWPEG